MTQDFEAELSVGPKAIDAYSRLSYTMWFALAEFVDNSTQSRPQLWRFRRSVADDRRSATHRLDRSQPADEGNCHRGQLDRNDQR